MNNYGPQGDQTQGLLQSLHYTECRLLKQLQGCNSDCVGPCLGLQCMGECLTMKGQDATRVVAQLGAAGAHLSLHGSNPAKAQASSPLH